MPLLQNRYFSFGQIIKFGLAFKVLAGLGLGLIYHFYYQNPKADTFLYFEDAVTLSEVFLDNPKLYFKIVFFHDFSEVGKEYFFWFKAQPRALLMSVLLSPVALITFKNYWLSSICLSIFCFFGILKLVKVLIIQFPEKALAIYLGFIIFPSVVFWSAGVMKETIVMGCMCLSLTFLLEDTKISWIKWLFIGFSAFIVASMKYYYFAVLVPVLMAYVFAEKLKTVQKHWQKFLLFFLTFFLLILTASFIHPNLRLDSFLQALVKNHDIMLQNSDNQLIIKFQDLQPDWVSVLKNLPLAMISGLFRPFIWETSTTFQIWIGLENLYLLLASFYTIYQIFIRKITISNPLLVIAVLTYILVLATLLALSSPNLGTLSRYKVAFLPFFIVLIHPVLPQSQKENKFQKGKNLYKKKPNLLK